MKNLQFIGDLKQRESWKTIRVKDCIRVYFDDYIYCDFVVGRIYPQQFGYEILVSMILTSEADACVFKLFPENLMVYIGHHMYRLPLHKIAIIWD